MYDFLLNEVWWMETIIASVITGVITLIVSFFAYNHKLQEVICNLNKLFGEHNTLFNEHSKLIDGHGKLSDGHNKLHETQNKISASVQRTETKVEKLFEDMLIKQGKDISVKEAIEQMVELQNLLLSQEKRIIELQEKNSILETENQNLKEKSNYRKKQQIPMEDSFNKSYEKKQDDYEL